MVLDGWMALDGTGWHWMALDGNGDGLDGTPREPPLFPQGCYQAEQGLIPNRGFPRTTPVRSA